MEKLIEQVKAFLPKLDENTIGSVYSSFEKKEIEKGAFIIKEGKICDKLYFIDSGYTRSYSLDEGKETTIWFCFDGEFVTAFNSFFHGIPCRQNIVAMVPCTMFYITNKKLNEQIKKNTLWETAVRLFITRYALQQEDRIYLLQSLSAVKKYQYLIDNYPHMIKTIPNKYIASFIGITNQSLSRIRTKARISVTGK